MVKQTRQDLRRCAREFSSVKDTADEFVEYTCKMFRKIKKYRRNR